MARIIAPTKITLEQAQALVRQWNAENKAFRVVNVKKDGDTRPWIVNPKAGRAALKGTGKPLPINSDMMHVWDARCVQPRDEKGRLMPIPADANGWRTLNTKTVRELSRGARGKNPEVYIVA